MRRELLTLELDPRSPERGQFGFTQSLVREVAYSTLTQPQRRERHLAAARYLEASGGDELAGALAGHYVAAHEASVPGAEAEAVAAQARLALRGAAERAAALGGHQQAADFITQALTVTTAPADRAALLHRHAQEVDTAGDHEAAETSIRSAISLYRDIGDATNVARSRTFLGLVLIMSGKEEAAVDELQAALAELPLDSDAEVRADLLTKLSRALYRNNQWAAAVQAADEALTIAESHRLLRVVADALVSKGSALNMATRIVEAMALLRAGYDLARRVGDTATELRAGANLSLSLGSEVSARQAMDITLASLETARKVGDFPQVVWQTNNAVFGAFFLW